MNKTELPSVCISMLPGLSSLQRWWMLSCSGWMKSWEVTMTSTSSPWARSWPGCSLQHPPTRQFSSHPGWPSAVTWTRQTLARYVAVYWRFAFHSNLFNFSFPTIVLWLLHIYHSNKDYKHVIHVLNIIHGSETQREQINSDKEVGNFVCWSILYFPMITKQYFKCRKYPKVHAENEIYNFCDYLHSKIVQNSWLHHFNIFQRDCCLTLIKVSLLH